MPRSTVGEVVLLEQNDITLTHLGEVIRNAAPKNATANNHDLGLCRKCHRSIEPNGSESPPSPPTHPIITVDTSGYCEEQLCLMGVAVGMDSAISVQGLWKVYGPRAEQIVTSPDANLSRNELEAKTGCVVAMRDINVEVMPGETFVVMGLSGSGKSTLVRCLTRLIEPTAGTVTIGGINVTKANTEQLLDVRRTKVSMVFQHFGLLPHRTLIDNIAFGLEVRGVDKATRRAKAEEILSLVGLEGLGGRKPDQLSGGMQQRVGLARALATDPDILLFDEPFSALDPLIRRDMQDEVMRLQREVNKTMVFITHDLSEALRLGDRIAIMRDGRFVQVGTPQQVVSSPADDYVRNFVRDVPKSHVVPVESIMTPPHSGPYAGSVPAASKVRDIVRHLVGSDLPLQVTNAHGAVVGSVDRLAVLRVIADEDIAEVAS